MKNKSPKNIKNIEYISNCCSVPSNTDYSTYYNSVDANFYKNIRAHNDDMMCCEALANGDYQIYKNVQTYNTEGNNKIIRKK